MDRPNPTTSDTNRQKLLLAGLLVLTAAVYANGLGGTFLFDDPLLTQSAWLQKPVSQWGWGKPNPFGNAAQRPLVTASFYFDYFLFGKNPAGYHAINLALALLNVSLAWKLFGRLGMTLTAAFIAAAVFAVHPVQTETVTYISGRRDLLLGLFYLLFFHGYLSYRGRTQRRWLAAAGLGVLFFVGLAAKEALATAIGVVILYEVTAALLPWGTKDPLQRTPREALSELGKTMRRNGWLIAICFAVATPLVLHRAFISTHQIPSRGAYWIGGSPLTHYFTAAKAQVVLFWRLLCPVTLLGDYTADNPLYSSGLGDLLGWAAVALIIFLVVMWFWLLLRRPWEGFALTIIMLGLLPSSQIFRHGEPTAEHYLYIPMLGFGILVAMGYGWLRSNPRENLQKLATPLVSLLLVLYGIRAVIRNQDYATPITFWTSVEQIAPRCARAQVNLGVYEIEAGQTDNALQRFERALEFDPHNAGAAGNMAVALRELGRFDEALEKAREAVEFDSTAVTFRAELARLLLYKKQPGEAWTHIEWLRQNVPGYPELQELRSAALGQQMAQINERRKKETETRKNGPSASESLRRRPPDHPRQRRPVPEQP